MGAAVVFTAESNVVGPAMFWDEYTFQVGDPVANAKGRKLMRPVDFGRDLVRATPEIEGSYQRNTTLIRGHDTLAFDAR
jgi:hypothetical protein